MTSPHTTIYTPFADGRPVRDIVEHTPALVNETWCRTLLRHTLDSLEQQYATGAPQRSITPDTLVMLANGEALLMPLAENTPATAPDIPADLHALALVVHYAITAELQPDGPLGPRLYENYSEQLTKGLDSCLGPNRRLRPQTVDGMRALLGIEASATVLVPDENPEPSLLAPAAPAPSVPEAAVTQLDIVDPVVAAPEPASLRERTESGMLRKPASPDSAATDTLRAPRASERIAPTASAVHDSADPVQAAPRKPSATIPPGAPRGAAPQPPAAKGRNSRVQRWGMMAGAAIVVLAAGSALVSYMQQNDARNLVPLTQPAGEPGAGGLDTGETVVAPPADAIATDQPTSALPADSPLDATTGAAPETGPGVAGVAPQAATQPAGSTNAAVVNGTTYKLLIKPWGTLYVNGIDHGVSPPVKRLTLGPGRHTIVIVNPNFAEHTMIVDAGVRETAIIEHDFQAQSQ
ncbi:hypothetical protein ACHAC9_07065 [Massilia sp. CMS3.1]|uniref:hypothetical protein n=1 Tax=Massilia sp. CMS3.1 TaxID=3373083 RepID=UPI003EE44552